MAKTLLIVGAGPGFARASARRFGSEGWRIHLVARTPANVERLAAEIGAEGVDCCAHVGDVTRHAELTRLVTEIDDDTPIDAAIFQPRGADDIVDVRAATVENVQPHLNALVLGGVAVGQALVPVSYTHLTLPTTPYV